MKTFVIVEERARIKTRRRRTKARKKRTRDKKKQSCCRQQLQLHFVDNELNRCC
jgi:hypothetical protein